MTVEDRWDLLARLDGPVFKFGMLLEFHDRTWVDTDCAGEVAGSFLVGLRKRLCASTGDLTLPQWWNIVSYPA